MTMLQTFYYVVTYDLLHKPSKNYKSLTDTLEQMDGQHYQESCWLVEIHLSAEEVKEKLAAHVHKDDLLMVIPFSVKPECTNALPGTEQWIEKRFPRNEDLTQAIREDLNLFD